MVSRAAWNVPSAGKGRGERRGEVLLGRWVSGGRFWELRRGLEGRCSGRGEMYMLRREEESVSLLHRSVTMYFSVTFVCPKTW